MYNFGFRTSSSGCSANLSLLYRNCFFQMSEPHAFELFRYVMFDLGIRRQYKPDMVAVQVEISLILSNLDTLVQFESDFYHLISLHYNRIHIL